ncbi:MAG TPA: M28 family peptidase [Verrucomicrobiae bacterium]|nr:M28 family peptidase [Verrucomicrobiae bacterium]
MLVQHSANAQAAAPDVRIKEAANDVSVSFLRGIVETMAVPRHYELQPENNRLTARWIARQLCSYGYDAELQGEYANVVARSRNAPNTPCVLVGAHYDSVPGTPGADDNASAVAALLACAKALAGHAPECPVCFASFNREEDGLLGSADFVRTIGTEGRISIREAHVLEMVGYCDHRPGSQAIPPGLPIQIPDHGDFLGILANKDSTAMASTVLQTARTYWPGFPVLSLKVYAGVEKLLPVLQRSDHAPFWKAGIPAIMWTDTSEFRNHNYHQPTDTPDTLDYDFLRSVSQILIATVLTSVQN